MNKRMKEDIKQLVACYRAFIQIGKVSRATAESRERLASFIELRAPAFIIRDEIEIFRKHLLTDGARETAGMTEH